MSDSEIGLRDAVDSDAAAIAEIFRPYAEETVITFAEKSPSLEHWEGTIDRVRAGARPFLVVEVDARVVGYAYVKPWRHQAAYRHTVEAVAYLDRKHTGRGLGRRLFAELITRCRAAGYHSMIGVVARDGEVGSAPEGLLTSLGFTVVGTLEGVGTKLGRRVDTRLLQLRLDS